MDQPATVDARVRQLERIVDQMESFIDEQMGRWETVVNGSDEAMSMRAQAALLLSEAESQRADWDRERGERIAKLQDETNLLEEAWKRIEAEDRRLAAKESIAERTNVTVMAPAQSETKTVDKAPSTDIDETQDRITAVQEFRKLSLEIANHAKRNR